MQDRKMQDLKMKDLLGMRRAFVVRGTEAGEHRADMSKHCSRSNGTSVFTDIVRKNLTARVPF